MGKIPTGDITNIYFVEAVGLKMVKIGRSTDPEKRVGAIQAMCPVPVRLLAVMEDVKPDAERAIHLAFDDDRKRGEWFYLTDDLRGFIEEPSMEILQEYVERKDAELLPTYYEQLDDGDYKFLFGKYNGERLSEVYQDDYSYIDWMIWKADFPLSVKELLAEFDPDGLRMIGEEG